VAESSILRLIRQGEQPFRLVGGDGASGLALARLYQNAERAFTFQLARIEPGGISRRHRHAWEQVNFVLSGEGIVETEEGQLKIGPGDCVIMEGDVEHAILNQGSEPLLLVGVLGPGAA
jgi:mannose-6-phosphate isomerase-like protein (cupin superfamily)